MPVSVRTRWVFCIVENKLVWINPMLAAKNFSISPADDRSAPAPARVGISQLETWLSPTYPLASRASSSGVNVILVLVIPSSLQTLLTTRSS